ncbi:hypothetical protein ACOME3_010023 [Neoechinorhynchus agilis]
MLWLVLWQPSPWIPVLSVLATHFHVARIEQATNKPNVQARPNERSSILVSKNRISKSLRKPLDNLVAAASRCARSMGLAQESRRSRNFFSNHGFDQYFCIDVPVGTDSLGLFTPVFNCD